MQQQDMQNIPIDINANKLLDWLVSRRHCTREWQNSILPIREKINNAIQDMPVHEGITKLLSGSYINYFHCLKIIEILKETEKDSKNFFGQYGSKRMKEWQEVVKMYEKDNLYLVEAAQMLARNVNYEVPSMRRQITKCEQSQDECDKKESECIKSAASIRHEFDVACKQLGISESKDIKRQLVCLVSELPGLLTNTAELIKHTIPAQRQYAVFSNFVLNKDINSTWTPLLAYVAEHGNTTTYEYTYGEPPLKIEEPSLDIQFDDDGFADGIDFGEETGVIDFGGEIDFGAVVDEIELTSTGDIDWGNIGAAAEITENPQEIDFNISLEETGIVLEEAGHAGGLATGTDALTLLDNPRTRNSILDELIELEAFFKVRVSQSTDDSGGLLTLSQMQGAPVELQDLSTEAVTKMLAAVQAVQMSLMEQRQQHLHNIKNSPRYVDQLAAKLLQKLKLADKMDARREAVKAKREEAASEVANLKPQVKLIIEKTRQLQEEIEKDISKKYKGRPVNIMGGGNILT